MAKKAFYNHGGRSLSELELAGKPKDGIADLKRDGRTVVVGVPIIEEGAPLVGQASLKLNGAAPKAPAAKSDPTPNQPDQEPTKSDLEDPVAHFSAKLEAGETITVEELVENCSADQLEEIAEKFDLNIPSSGTKAEVAAAILGPESE